MKRTLIALAVLAMLTPLAGCKEDPVAPATYDGTNGMLLDAVTFTLIDNTNRSYTNLRIDFDRASLEFDDANGIQRAVHMGDYILERREVEMKLALPASFKGPGTYVWVDGEAPSTTEAYAIMSRDEVEYTSVRGSTIVTKYNPVGGTVEGTFSGTIRHPETRVETKVDGRFSAQRLN